MVALHFVIASAIGLIASGASSLMDTNPKPSSLGLVKVGMVLLIVSCVVILLVALVTLFYDDGWNRKNARSGAVSSWDHQDGTKVSSILSKPKKNKKWMKGDWGGTTWYPWANTLKLFPTAPVRDIRQPSPNGDPSALQRRLRLHAIRPFEPGYRVVGT